MAKLMAFRDTNVLLVAQQFRKENKLSSNVIDGQFSDLKNKLRNHNGLSLERKKKFIDEFFKA